MYSAQNSFQVLIGVVTVVAIIALSVMLAMRDTGGTTPAASSGATTAAQSFMMSRRQRPETEKLLSTPFRGLGERSNGISAGTLSASSFKQSFGTCLAEKQMGGGAVLHAPKGVQPGTLIGAPYGETHTAPLYDSRYGFKSNFHGTGSTAERMDGVGPTAAGAGHNEGLMSRFTSKEESIRALNAVADKYDQFLSDKLFPEAVVIQRKDNTFVIKERADDSGNPDAPDACVSMENYYDYVGASIATEMGVTPAVAMSWAKGSGIGLRFDDIDRNIDALRAGLRVNCDNAAGYKVTSNERVRSLANAKTISYDVKWPADQTLLMTHYATVG